jgi:FkbM family methyltransferase
LVKKLKKDRLFFPPSLDLKYTLTAMKRLARYPSVLPSLLGGADALNRLLVDLYARNPVTVVHTHGFDVCLDPNDMGVSPSIAVLGWHEMKTTELFIKLVGRGSTVIDVGANVGFFTLLAAKLVGKKGYVLSFEPEPTSFSLLAQSVKRNGFGNVEMFEKCVSNVDGQQTLHLSVTRNKGLHSIARDLGGDSISVQSARLDTVVNAHGIGSIDLLKIDAEGAEPEVLEGAERLLSRSSVRNIIMEWEHPESWARRSDILEMIFSRFDVFEFVRSLPFLPARKLAPDSTSLFAQGAGTNLYLRRRPLTC